MPPAEAAGVTLLKSVWAAQRARMVLWVPVLLMLGTGSYFSLGYEPPESLGIGLLLAASLALAAGVRTRFRLLVFGLFLIALGFAAAQWRAHQAATPLLSQELRFRAVEGTVDDIDPVENKEKLVLSHLVIEGLPPEKTPLRVRVSFRDENPDLRVGDRVRFQASLFPLPPPAMPGAYDFARYFYFQGIGGSGFAMRRAERIEGEVRPDWVESLSNLRHAIGEDMRGHMSKEAGTVAAAMTIGEMGPIPTSVNDALRDSGLSHILSISGLHLSIATGIIFYNLRLLLTLWPWLALRIPVKKIAALGALISAFIYLMLAGAPIPAQRSFIMVAFLLTAMLFDRRGITLRTLSLTAALLVLLFPEAMLGASFQMSFAATLSIDALYEMAGGMLFNPNLPLVMRIARHVMGIALTSLAATVATAPFVLYHFNRFALLGLISNMIVIPLATFVIMPGMVVALILMPLGGQWLGYIPLEWGTDVMIRMARWVTSLPYASLRFASPTDAGLLAAAFGLLWLCLVAGRIRYLGALIIMAGLSTIALHQPVDVFISRDARQLMVRLDDGRYAALKGTARSFTVQNWLRSEAQDALVPLEETDIECDKSLCTYHHNGRTLVFVKNTRDNALVQQACAQSSDVLVTWRYLHREDCPAPAMLIGRGELEAGGAHILRMGSSGVKMLSTRPSNAGHRLWQPAYDETELTEE